MGNLFRIESTGRIGIGVEDPGDTAHVNITDLAINTAVSNTGLLVNRKKTLGATDASDNIYGAQIAMEFDDDGALDSLFGAMAGLVVSTTATDSTGECVSMSGIINNVTTQTSDSIDIENVYGYFSHLNILKGTVDASIYGAYINVDIDAGIQAVVNVYGQYIIIDDSKGASGTVYGTYIDCDAGVDYGLVVDGSGVLIGRTTNTWNQNGIVLDNAGFGYFERTVGGTGSSVIYVHRRGHDGQLLTFYSENTEEGSISVSGSTVTYTNFFGSHYTELSDGIDQSSLLVGTVLDSTDPMVENKYATGKRLPKCKVSTVADSSGVYGVYHCDEVYNDVPGTDDGVPAAVVGLNAGGLGAYFIRIHKDIDVAIGDLLTSNGDGTAKKQDDDIIRSKTIGKVTSTTKKETYADGSYIVPCVLYCG